MINKRKDLSFGTLLGEGALVASSYFLTNPHAMYKLFFMLLDFAFN